MKNIQDTLKNLTPIQKLEILDKELEKAKSKKDKDQIKTLISGVKREQSVLEESLRQLETKKQEEPKEEHLEQIVEETAEEQPKGEKKDTKPGDLYGVQSSNNVKALYGVEKLENKYLSIKIRTCVK